MKKTAVSANITTMVISALLVAIGIIIPLLSPLKIVIPPASFTLGSHVAIFIAMFVSLPVGIVVSIGTTIGFLLGGFPIVIVLRALTHIVFVAVGAIILKKTPELLTSPKKTVLFSLFLSLIHAVCEVAIVTVFFFGGNSTENYVITVMLLVGVGTVIHSMVDFGIALAVWKLLGLKNKTQ